MKALRGAMVLLALGSLGLTACGANTETVAAPAGTTVPQTVVALVTIPSDGSYRSSDAGSLVTLIATHPNVIVGRVESASPYFLAILPPPDSRPEPDAGQARKPTPAPQTPVPRLPDTTMYEIRIVEAIAGEGLERGDLVRFLGPGAVVEGVAYEHEADPLLPIGSTQLLFMVLKPTFRERLGTVFMSPPYGRFVVAEASGAVEPVTGRWARTGAAQALGGRALGDMILSLRQLAKDIKDGKITPTPRPPDRGPLLATPTPYRAPTPTLTPPASRPTSSLPPFPTPPPLPSATASP